MNNYKSNNKTKKFTGRNSNRKENKEVGKLLPSNSNISKDNDPSWYGTSPQLIKDAASLPYAHSLGAPIDLNGVIDSVPGLMRILIQPTIGISTNNYSAVNVAARNIYSFVRHANSGHSNYDAPDLMMYLLAMDSAYSLYSFMVRAYGVMSLYTHYNKYYPRAIIEGMNLDPDDFMANLADFRYYLNQFVHKIGSFAVPASMPFFKRHMWMYEGLYVDDSSVKAQTYFFVPDGFYKFNEYDGAGKLEYKTFWGTGMFTVKGLMDYAEDLISKIYESEDMNIMSGDILKAFGNDGILKVAEVAPDYIVLPAYNEEVLSQIQNATILPKISNTDITQDVNTGALLFNPIKEVVTTNAVDFASQGAVYDVYAQDRLLNMYKDSPTPEDTMVATRLMTSAKITRDTTNSKITMSFEHAGTEMVVGVAYAKFGIDGNQWVPSWYSTSMVIQQYWDEGSSVGTLYNQALVRMNKIVNISKFRFHPALFVIDVRFNSASGTITNYTSSGHIIDLNNFTIVDERALGKMHETALISEFTCPMMGAFNKKTLN